MGSETERIAGRLAEQGEQMIGFLRGLDPGEWAQIVYADHGTEPWTVRQIAIHLLSAEAGFHALIRDILAGGEGAPAGMDLDAFNADQVNKRGDLSAMELVAELAAARAKNVSLAASLSEQDLQRTGRHPFLGLTTLDKQLKLIYRHAMMHLRDIYRSEE